jgi:hypothetical protein
MTLLTTKNKEMRRKKRTDLSVEKDLKTHAEMREKSAWFLIGENAVLNV